MKYNNLFFLLAIGLLSLIPANLTAQLSGIYTIGGAGPDYATFNAAVTDLETSGVSGPVTFNVRSGTYSEQIEIDAIAGTSDINRVVFQAETGDSSDVILKFNASSSTSNYTIRLNDCSYLTFQHLTIRSEGSAFARVFELITSPTNIQIKNCAITSVPTANTATTHSLIFESSSFSDVADEIEIRNNYFLYGSYAIMMNTADHIRIEGNELEFQTRYGFYTNTCDSIHIKSNEVLAFPASNNYIGIYLGACDGPIDISGNSVILQNAGTAMALSGCASGLSPGTEGLISNNFLSVKGTNESYCLDIYSLKWFDIHHNSLYCESPDANSRAFYLGSITGSTSLSILNNIIQHNSEGVAYYIRGDLVIKESDFNNIVTNGADLAYWDGTTVSNLSELVTLSLMDSNSISIDPHFPSNDDLHFRNALIDNLGTPTSPVDGDIDGEVRDPVTPDIGADEFTPPPHDIGVLDLDADATMCTSSEDVWVRLLNYGDTTITSCTVNWRVNGVIQPSFAWTGSLPKGDTSIYFDIGDYAFLPTTSYDVEAWTTLPNGVPDGQMYNDTARLLDDYMQMSGVYTIGGIAPDYNTWNDAVTDLNNGGICGPVIFNVRSGTYNEQVFVDHVYGISPTNTITFQSESGDSSTVTLEWESSSIPDNYTLRFWGCSYITVRNLHIKATAADFLTALNFISPFEGVLVENCILEAEPYVGTSVNHPIISFSGNGGKGILQNSHLINGVTGIYASSDYTYPDTGGVIQNNLFENQHRYGIHIFQTYAHEVRNNVIRSENPDIYYNGLYTYRGHGPIRYMGNKIYAPWGTGFYISVSSGESFDHGLIANNFVTIDSVADNRGAIFHAFAGYHDFYHNSVATFAGGFPSGAFYADHSSAEHFNNSYANFGTQPGIRIYDYSTIDNADNNNYYSNGSQIGFYWGASGHGTIASWNSATGFDANSISVDPEYYAPPDLHSCSSSLNNAGTFAPIITEDIDGEARSLFTPDIGADEISGAGWSADLGPDKTDCKPVTLQPACPGGSYAWSTGDTSESVTVASSGTYYVSLTNSCGTYTDSISVTITGGPVVDLGPDTMACPGTAFILDAGNPGATFAWSTGGSAMTESVEAPGTFYVQVTEGACAGIDTIDISSPAAMTVDAGSDVSITFGGSTILSASVTGSTSPYDYLWTPGGITTPSWTASPGSTTTYYVEVTDSGGCTEMDSVTVMVAGAPLGLTITADTIICEGDSLMLTGTPSGGSGTYSYSWTPGGASTASIMVSPGTMTTYSLTVEDTIAAESTSDNVTISVSPTITADADFDHSICEGDTVTLTGSATGGSGALNYAWMPGPYSGPVISLSPDTTTTMVLTVTDTAGCADQDSSLITVFPMPTAYAGPDTTICAGDTITLLGSGSGMPNWDATPNLSDPLVYDPLAFPTSDETFILSVGLSGCFDQDTVNVFVDPQPIGGFTYTVIAPNTVSFTSTSSGAASWLWDFGDLGASFAENPSHIYASGGMKYVCLTVGNGTSCTDTFCDSVNVVMVNLQDAIDEDFMVSAYPNPSEDWVHLSIHSKNPNIEIRIWNELGQVIRQEIHSIQGSGIIDLDVSSLASGVYHLEVRSAESRKMIKLGIK